MPQSPPRTLEAVVEFFIPAAAREYILGDLRERYRSPRRYAWDALRVVPMVVLGRILRYSQPARMALEFASMLLACYATALVTGEAAMGRALLAAMIGFTVLVVRDAYSAVDCAHPMTAIEAGFLACIIQLGLGPLSWKTSLLGTMLGAGMIFAVRLNGRHQPRVVTQSLEEVPERARRFDRAVRQRNVREYVGVAVVLLSFGFAAFRAPDAARFVPPLMMCTGACAVGWFLYRRGTPSRLPAASAEIDLLRFYRGEVERQRALLAGIWWWYLGPLIPGFVAIAAVQMSSGSDWKRGVVSLATIAAVLTGVAWLNRREAKHLQREIDSLDAIERRSL